MILRIILAVSLFLFGGLMPPRSWAKDFTITQKEELLDKAQAALIWFYTLGDEVAMRRTSPQKYHEQISPLELIQAAAILHEIRQDEPTALAEKLLPILPFYRLSPEECFELYDLLGDEILSQLSEIRTEFIEKLPLEANRFRTTMLNNAEKVVLHSEPATALEVMQAVDVLSVVGRPVLVRHYLRRLLTGDYALTPEEAARIVETIGTQKLMQLAIHPEFVPLGKETVAKIIDEAKKHWQDPDRIAEALKETQWFEDGARAEGISPPVSPQVRPEALPALQVIWKGDLLSVQQVFEKLGTIEDEREADELTAVLLALRPDMKEALAAAWDSQNPKLRYHAARGLAVAVTPQDSFLLFPFLFLGSDEEFIIAHHISNIEGEGEVVFSSRSPAQPDEIVNPFRRLPESERDAVKNILQQRRIAVPSQEQAAAILFERATDYFERRRPLRTDADGNVSFWIWVPGIEGGIQNFSQYDIETAYRYFAFKYYSQSLNILPSESANREVYGLMNDIAYPEYFGHRFPIYGHTLTYLGPISVGNTSSEQLLQASIEKNRFQAATFAITSIQAQRKRELANYNIIIALFGGQQLTDFLQSTDGKPRILVQATVAHDCRVRFAALETIMSLNPTEPFAGSSLVADTLVWFSRSEGQRVILSGHPQMATANRTASLFLGLDYQTDVATTCRDLFRLAAASPDVEAVFVDVRTTQPPVGEFVQMMRQDARTANIPIAVLGGDDTRAGGISPPVTPPRDSLVQNRGANARPLVGEYPRLASEESARWVLKDLFDKCGGLTPAGADVRLAQAKQALVWLRKIKEVELQPRAPKIFHFDDFDAVVLNALHSERRVREGLDLAAVVRSPVLQSAIYDLAANAIYPMELREYAGDAFERNVQRFGILLRGQQIQRLYDRYNQSEFEPQESQELLSRLIDVVKNQSRNL